MFLVLASGSLLWAPIASADGDPASDVLYAQRAFLPYDVSFPPRLQSQLRQLLTSSSKAGYPIRVAIVASGYDLGSIGQLWGKPQIYARFLGTELSLTYHGLLLVVMPSGFGVYHGGRPVIDRTIARRYAKLGRWAGLAIWLDLTREWLDGEEPSAAWVSLS